MTDKKISAFTAAAALTGTEVVAGVQSSNNVKITTQAIANLASVGSAAFSALTGGTNTTAAMVVGTGASLAASGSGTITATAVPASGLTGTTLPAGVTASSLTSVGTLTGLTINGLLVQTGTATTAYTSTNTSASGSTAGAFALFYSNDSNPLVAGDRLGGLIMGGSNTVGSGVINTCAVVGFANETWSSTAGGSYFTFEVCPTGSVSRTERLRIVDGITITSSGANALAVGPSGTTNPTLKVNSATASAATGIEIIGAAAGGGVAVNAISSGTNESINISAKGSGNAVITGGTQVQMSVGGSIFAGTASQLAFTNITRNSTTNTAALFTGIASGIGGNSLTAGSEVHSLYANYAATQTHGSNTAITTQRDIRVTGSTHAFQTATGTITNAAALAIDGAPIAGTNAAITNGSSIYSPGAAVGAGTTNSYGLNIKANTGATNNYCTRYEGSAGEIFRVRTDGQIALLATNTAGGTTGNQTIDKPSGTVNIAAAGTTVTVTNALCTTSSIVFAVIRTNDATARIANVVPGAGSFVINIVACTAEVSIGFFIIN